MPTKGRSAPTGLRVASKGPNQCHRHGCDSAAKFKMGLELVCEGGQVLKCISSIAVCPNHVNHACDYMLTDRNRATIDKGLKQQGYKPIAYFKPVVLPF